MDKCKSKGVHNILVTNVWIQGWVGQLKCKHCSKLLFRTENQTAPSQVFFVILQTGSDLKEARDYLTDAYETTQQTVQVRVQKVNKS